MAVDKLPSYFFFFFLTKASSPSLDFQLTSLLAASASVPRLNAVESKKMLKQCFGLEP